MTLLEELRNVIGDRTDDDALALIERVSELESQGIDDLKNKITELEGQMKQLDEDWRKRYRDRFYEGEKDIEDESEEEAGSEEEAESVSIDDLFEE